MIIQQTVIDSDKVVKQIHTDAETEKVLYEDLDTFPGTNLRPSRDY